jgi:hypothetical protein
MRHGWVLFVFGTALVMGVMKQCRPHPDSLRRSRYRCEQRWRG